mmetsp:Transcript_29439/g.57627  ORF Transcript_29439/g.57627 Transcript_29439/m.57627 type:complete len:325 (+) Transcript_29439:335-1309(+)
MEHILHCLPVCFEFLLRSGLILTSSFHLLRIIFQDHGKILNNVSGLLLAAFIRIFAGPLQLWRFVRIFCVLRFCLSEGQGDSVLFVEFRQCGDCISEGINRLLVHFEGLLKVIMFFIANCQALLHAFFCLFHRLLQFLDAAFCGLYIVTQTGELLLRLCFRSLYVLNVVTVLSFRILAAVTVSNIINLFLPNQFDHAINHQYDLLKLAARFHLNCELSKTDIMVLCCQVADLHVSMLWRIDLNSVRDLQLQQCCCSLLERSISLLQNLDCRNDALQLFRAQPNALCKDLSSCLAGLFGILKEDFVGSNLVLGFIVVGCAIRPLL